MTLLETIHTIKNVALNQANVRTFIEGDIYENLNANPSVEYDCICLTQSNHTREEYFNNFNFNIFYVSRLESDLEDNKLLIQSIGIEVIANILKVLGEAYDIEHSNPIYTTFSEKFADSCAGVYATISLKVEADLICGETY